MYYCSWKSDYTQMNITLATRFSLSTEKTLKNPIEQLISNIRPQVNYKLVPFNVIPTQNTRSLLVPTYQINKLNYLGSNVLTQLTGLFLNQGMPSFGHVLYKQTNKARSVTHLRDLLDSSVMWNAQELTQQKNWLGIDLRCCKWIDANWNLNWNAKFDFCNMGL